MKPRISVALIVALIALMTVAGVALPALARQDPWADNQQQYPSGSLVPPQPVCGWDWDRGLWQNYKFELWLYSCDYGNGNANISAFWNPSWGYWYPS